MRNALALLLLTLSASAAENPLQSACGADIKTFCADAPLPGVCLQANWNEISDGCKAFMLKANKSGVKSDGNQLWAKYCRPDVKRLCAGVAEPGKCLEANWKDVSDACKSFRPSMIRNQNRAAAKSDQAKPDAAIADPAKPAGK